MAPLFLGLSPTPPRGRGEYNECYLITSSPASREGGQGGRGKKEIEEKITDNYQKSY